MYRGLRGQYRGSGLTIQPFQFGIFQLNVVLENKIMKLVQRRHAGIGFIERQFISIVPNANCIEFDGEPCSQRIFLFKSDNLFPNLVFQFFVSP